MTPEVGRRGADGAETRAANRAWWDAEAAAYLEEHGAFLGDAEFVWGPEGWTEAELDLLRIREGMTVLEIGAGGGQCSRWVRGRPGVRVVASDLSAGMLRSAREIETRNQGPAIPLVQCDGTALPFADASVDRVFTAYGVMPFVADSCAVLREAARVLRPGGRFVFSTSHPIRWAFPDVPGQDGLTASTSYFDRTPYVESAGGMATYVEHHRTLGDWVRHAVRAGLVVLDVVEPPWPDRNAREWGGWSPLRGRILPGTVIVVTAVPGEGSEQ